MNNRYLPNTSSTRPYGDLSMLFDIPCQGVNMVINYDFPQSAVSYIHRIGRTGRAGRHGVAVTLFTESDMDSLRSIANVMRLSGCEVSLCFTLFIQRCSRTLLLAEQGPKGS